MLNIHFDSLVIDGHNDTMMKVIDEKSWLPKVNIGESTNFHINIDKLKRGGLNAPFFAAYSDGYYGDNPKDINRTLALINALYWTEKNNPDSFQIATSVDQILEIYKENKIAAIPTIEGGYSLNEENHMELLKQYDDLGVKALGFTWNYSNDLGEGASGTYNDDAKTKSPKGLTDLGKRVVKEMNRLGMLIDVSHMSEDSFWDTVNTSEDPIIASHSGAHKLRQHPRNLRDEQLKALAKNGGVIGIVLCPQFLTDSKNAYIKDFVDHIDHAVKLIGVDHVGLGSDFDGTVMPKDIKDSSELYKITEELIKRKYKDEDIKKILGGNILRLLKQVENKSKRNHKDIKIIPEYKMGDIISNSTPTLKAKIEMNNRLDDLEYKVIIDGISYKGSFDSLNSNLYFQLREPLNEKFHVVSFEVSNDKAILQRESRIFYLEK